MKREDKITNKDIEQEETPKKIDKSWVIDKLSTIAIIGVCIGLAIVCLFTVNWMDPISIAVITSSLPLIIIITCLAIRMDYLERNLMTAIESIRGVETVMLTETIHIKDRSEEQVEKDRDILIEELLDIDDITDPRK